LGGDGAIDLKRSDGAMNVKRSDGASRTTIGRAAPPGAALLRFRQCYGIAIPYRMAITSIKSTYSLDVDSVRKLDSIADRWRVSKSEALRRAIRIAAEQQASAGAQPTAALDALQRSLNLTSAAADRWRRKVRSERRAAAPRRRTGGAHGGG
jgi:uncharacterized protein YerC